MKKLNVIKPYSDEKLAYKNDRYYLTREYCKSAFETTFRNDDILDRRIKKNTDKVYNYIFSRVASYNMDVVSAILNRTEEGRNFILQLLEYQMDADIQSGYNDTSLIPAVNPSNGGVIAREELKRNLVTVDVEQALDNSLHYFGINLTYTGRMPRMLIYYALED